MGIVGGMMRYFNVVVSHYNVEISEVFSPLKKYEWSCTIDGEQCLYDIVKSTKSNIRNWFERGTTEVQYHAKNISQTGFVLWSKRSPRPRQLSKAKKAAIEKMGKLL